MVDLIQVWLFLWLCQLTNATVQERASYELVDLETPTNSTEVKLYSQQVDANAVLHGATMAVVTTWMPRFLTGLVTSEPDKQWHEA